jgi:hypothetical protein
MLFLADAGIPMIVAQWPLAAIVLIPVILIEALFNRYRLSISYRDSFAGTALANLVSTVAGVPLAWIVMLLIEITIGSIIPRQWWHSPIGLVLSLFCVAWLGPSDNTTLSWQVPLALSLLLIPTFFVSVWIERGVCKMVWRSKDQREVNKGVWRANLLSYGLLLTLGLSYSGYARFHKDIPPPITAYRVIEPETLSIVKAYGYNGFPAVRTTSRDSFLVILNETRARQYQAGTNKIITKFELDSRFLNRIVADTKQEARFKQSEYWIPGANLRDFNNGIIGKITVVEDSSHQSP